MIEKFALLRNIGTFESVSSGAQLNLLRLALVYAENGQGKTTIAAILRSLQTGSNLPIEERRRLGSTHPPHVVINLSAQAPAVYQNGAWSQTLPGIAIYDDVFVDENVHSGLVVESTHRQNLNEVILGAQGVALNTALVSLVERIEVHNRNIRTLAEAIPAATRGSLSPDEFCALTQDPNIDTAIEEARQALSAVAEAVSVQKAAPLRRLELPALDIGRLIAVGELNASLDALAVERVEAHVASLGEGGVSWVEQGVRFTHSGGGDSCPFCAQSIANVDIVHRYRAYFSSEFEKLRQQLGQARNEIELRHGQRTREGLATIVDANVQAWHFWARFTTLPSLVIDTNAVLSIWQAAYESAVRFVNAKALDPLTEMDPPADTVRQVSALGQLQEVISAANNTVDEINRAIALVKERAASGNIEAIEGDLRRLHAKKARYDPAIAQACDAYTIERAAKSQTETARDQARQALDAYRTTTFPAYEDTINRYLLLLNASFRIASVTSVSNRGGPSCTYSVVVNNIATPITSPPGGATPSFRNVLSAGDRNTLALAFFFAALDHDDDLASKIVVVDDPMTSLDEHRLLATAQHTRSLANRALQVIVLSHEKGFLFRIWDGADRNQRSAITISRAAVGSELASWNVNDEMLTEHDKRHEALVAYIGSRAGDPRNIAIGLRPILEYYLRAAYPDHYSPGEILGNFIDKCRTRVDGTAPILKQADIVELSNLKEYTNLFHHDTNDAAGGAIVNDAELLGFAGRVLAFIRRP